MKSYLSHWYEQERNRADRLRNRLHELEAEYIKLVNEVGHERWHHRQLKTEYAQLLFQKEKIDQQRGVYNLALLGLTVILIVSNLAWWIG